ncbi:T9SS type A sorting domain-containing protein [Flavobacterium lacisediminis]|uniref:T9SS type A sorting domain-containing protein n=1 Tax=Flavobacterium lacisediminis TaxID=2989705 RepID=A0ABT3EHD4_9FLAO|nr:T9SS type A sorting domain-containing protein [Flavobacterium lacisediminis]MCW1147524.1 T9SS type A sorting domain-containing protein [Flavobacterium lacisediminis]
MKKITFLFYFLANFYIAAQGYTTGTITLNTTTGVAMTAKIDVSTNVTLRLTGPSDRWFALGFGATSMTAGTDVVVCHANTATLPSFDRYLTGFSAPVSDGSQHWTITSNTVSGTVRTIIATRALNTSDTNDYTFSSTPNAINLIWAYGSTANNYSLTYHGGRGVTSANFTLGSDDFLLAQFKMYPNPSSELITVELPDGISSAVVSIYDYLGRIVIKESFDESSLKIVTSNLQKGTYIVKVASENGFATKILIVD